MGVNVSFVSNIWSSDASAQWARQTIRLQYQPETWCSSGGRLIRPDGQPGIVQWRVWPHSLPGYGCHPGGGTGLTTFLCIGLEQTTIPPRANGSCLQVARGWSWRIWGLNKGILLRKVCSIKEKMVLDKAGEQHGSCHIQTGLGLDNSEG